MRIFIKMRKKYFFVCLNFIFFAYASSIFAFSSGADSPLGADSVSRYASSSGVDSSLIADSPSLSDSSSSYASSSTATRAGSEKSKIIQSSISDIRHSLKNDSLKALWRASLLLQEYSDEEEVVSFFAQAFENDRNELENLEKDEDELEFYLHYTTVKTILSSIKDCNEDNFDISPFLSFYESSKNKIFASDLVQNSFKNQNAKKISQTIDGTVTVWVDLGAKLMNGKAFANKAIGSAFFIDDRGYLITNYHVISSEVDPKYEGVSRLYIKDSSDTEKKIPAKVIGYDELLDLALLKTEINPKYVFTLGTSSDLEVGDSIYAIGSPVGLERTLTRGIVSAQGRKLFSIASVMQIDAALNQGNSGGPVVDQSGSVQGIAFAGLVNYENLNFAIPVEYLKLDLPYLFCGEVKHSYIGAFGKTKRAEDGKSVGVEVLWLESSGNAAKAGMKKGDVITAVNGEPVLDLDSLHKALVKVRPHSIATFEVRSKYPANVETPKNGRLADKALTANDELLENDEQSIYEKNILVYTDVRTKTPLIDIYKKESVSNAFLPLFGLELTRSSTVSKSKFTVQSVVSGSNADESGFSALDPLQIMKTGVQTVQDSSFIFAEVYSKKRINGYLDAVMVLMCPEDTDEVF